MRTIDTIVAEIEANSSRRAEIDADIAAKVASFKADLVATHKAETDALYQRSNDLHLELTRAKAAAASHPLEGRAVWCNEVRRDRSYSLRAKDKWVKLRGKIVVVRSWEDMPPLTKANQHRQNPSIGDVIIQRVNAKGERLGEWEALTTDGHFPHNRWKLVEEQVAA